MAAGSTARARAQAAEKVVPGATEKLAPGGPKPIAKPPTGHILLTTNECLGLGGDVKTDVAVCAGTGQYCITHTISSTGVQHDNVQCITEKQ